MGSIFKPTMPAMPPIPEPKPLPEPVKAEDPEREEEVKEKRRKVLLNRKGRRSTILTGPLGIQESEEEQLDTLLGKKD